MKILKRILTVLFIVVFTTLNAFGNPNCQDKHYRYVYPERCKSSNNGTLLALAGGAALIGVGVAIASQTTGDHGSSSSISNQSSFPRATLSPNIPITYSLTDYIQNQKINAIYLNSLTNGTDISNSVINSIKSTSEYQRNYKQYNEIKFAWAKARGFDGTNISVNILDNFYSSHGGAVYEILHNIASDSIINTYNIGIDNQHFENYDSIANTLSQSGNANIYNASWQRTDISAANVVYHNTNTPKTYAQAQQYMYDLTSENFVTQIRNSAVDNDAIFIWAAGNQSRTESDALSALPIAFPDLQGHFVNVIAVDNYETIASYSNQCGVTQNYCIAAPGSLWNTDNQDYATGTSFAAPVVSGAIATIKEAFPYMNASQITALLFTTAKDLGDPGIDSVYGWGLLDMEKATKPVGTPKIVLSNEIIRPLSLSFISGSAAPAIQKANVKLAFVDDFGRAFTTNLSDHIKIMPHGRGFDKLREPETDSFTLVDNFEFGFSQNHLLDSNGLISVQSNQLTSFIGYKNEFNFGDIRFYQNARFGTTNPKAETNSIISNFSTIYTSSIKMGAQWNNFAFEFAIPETIVYGNMYATIPVARATSGEILYNNTTIDLSNTIPSTEYTIKYKHLSATYVNNPEYQDELFIMAKTKFAF